MRFDWPRHPRPDVLLRIRDCSLSTENLQAVMPEERQAGDAASLHGPEIIAREELLQRDVCDVAKLLSDCVVSLASRLEQGPASAPASVPGSISREEMDRIVRCAWEWFHVEEQRAHYLQRQLAESQQELGAMSTLVARAGIA